MSRQGGVEFIVLVSFEPVIIATRMPEAHFIDPHELHVITSICVAVYPEDGLDAAKNRFSGILTDLGLETPKELAQ